MAVILIIAALPEAFKAGNAALLAANVPSVSISMTVRKPLGLIASAAACKIVAGRVKTLLRDRQAGIVRQGKAFCLQDTRGIVSSYSMGTSIP